MKAIGIILAGGNNRMMRELSNKRAIAAMPIAGSYRAIDFALSNMTNSRIQKVAVITQYNARSLNEHSIRQRRMPIVVVSANMIFSNVSRVVSSQITSSW